MSIFPSPSVGTSLTTLTPQGLAYYRGVISQPGLKKHSESELVHELSDQKVCAARRINIKRDGKLIPTQHVILTFSTPELPKSIKAGYLRCPIKPYIPNPIRCFNCQKFGHSQHAYKSPTICAKCSMPGHDSSDCISGDFKCKNCQGDHPAFSKSCPQWILQKEIQTTKVRKNISFAEARKLVTDRTPKPGLAYSSVLKQCAHCGFIANSSNNTGKKSLQPAISSASTSSDNPLQIEKEPSTSVKTISVTSPSQKNKPQSLQQKLTINIPNHKNNSNVKTREPIKETKAAKRARLAALKKNKDFQNRTVSKDDFLKKTRKATKHPPNIDPPLDIHPSDDDILSTASETDLLQKVPELAVLFLPFAFQHGKLCFLELSWY
ncbi:uncharacterized protein LOC129987463 [Argiope bruennichi]|uniref:uncharacterized protein LOC129987463 n=1 Tax=Argiope bruennichi TaxID=94029 RepID=UPI00249522F2|nr:uncharacterized protein LOC129987463 [Argiope bruennichi]